MCFIWWSTVQKLGVYLSPPSGDNTYRKDCKRVQRPSFLKGVTESNVAAEKHIFLKIKMQMQLKKKNHFLYDD